MLPNRVERLTLENATLKTSNKLLKKELIALRKSSDDFFNKCAGDTLEEVDIINNILIKAGWDKKMGGYTDHHGNFRHGYPKPAAMLKFFLKYTDLNRGIHIHAGDIK